MQRDEEHLPIALQLNCCIRLERTFRNADSGFRVIQAIVPKGEMRLTDIRCNAVWQALRGDGHVPKELLVLTGTLAVIVPVGRFIPSYLQGNDLTYRISCWNQHPRLKVEAPHAVYPEKTGYASQLTSAFGKDGGRNETCDKPLWGTALEDIVLANRRNQLLILLLRFPVTVDPRKIG